MKCRSLQGDKQRAVINHKYVIITWKNVYISIRTEWRWQSQVKNGSWSRMFLVSYLHGQVAIVRWPIIVIHYVVPDVVFDGVHLFLDRWIRVRNWLMEVPLQVDIKILVDRLNFRWMILVGSVIALFHSHWNRKWNCIHKITVLTVCCYFVIVVKVRSCE